MRFAKRRDRDGSSEGDIGDREDGSVGKENYDFDFFNSRIWFIFINL
jgi:hypothetical protein